DFVVHLGDYTYETVALEGQDSSFQGGGPEERQFRFPSGDGDEELTLEDYRFTYKLYKTDENLQAVHENFAMIMIWDDHEFANDAYQTFAPDQGGNQDGNKDNPRRREFANLAWFQYNPVGVFYNSAKDPINEIAIYRSFAFGKLMELVMTDERLYRDGPPCGNDTQDRSLTPGCGAEESEGRTMLGDGTPGENGRLRPRQLDYFTQKITRSPRTWKIWGNEVTVMQLKVANSMLGAELPPGTISSLEELFPGIEDFPAASSVGAPEGVYTTLDGWDGYQAERNRIMRTFRDDGTFPGRGNPGVKNFITITGDIHSYFAEYLKEDFDEISCSGDNRPVGIELVSPSITSSNLSEIAQFGFGAAPRPEVNLFTTQVTANNPHIKYFNSEQHGYNIVEVTEDSLVCEMKAVVVPEENITQENRGSAIREPERENTEIELLKRFLVPAFGTDAPGVPGTTVTEPMLYDATLSEDNPVLFLCPVPVGSTVNEGVVTGG
ncbi:MAG: alkaline phosphatase D family protein, partial [Rubrobacter sp.]